MLERLKDLPVGVVGLSAKGKITKGDYAAVMRPLLDEARRDGHRIKLLYHIGSEFEGFTPGAAWEDARIGLHDLRLFGRCAIVSDVGWIRETTRLFGAMMPCPVKVFANNERGDAVSWLVSDVSSENLSHVLHQDKGVLVVEPKGPLRMEDFEALALAVDPWIEAHGTLSGFVVHARHFPGWESIGGFLSHIRFVRDHHKKVRRVALATDIQLAVLAPKVAAHFTQAEVKPFAYDRLDEAIAWAGAEARPKAAHDTPTVAHP